MLNYPARYLSVVGKIAAGLDIAIIDKMIGSLVALREREGRLFILGVGGSAANCSHAVNDFRKLTGIEAYAPSDNVAELTARTNDEGWETVFSEWLKVSRLGPLDAVLILSVGGGNRDKNVSVNLIRALDLAKAVGATILGIVSRDGGYTAQVAHASIVVPIIDQDMITPQAESWQGIIWHLLVSDPRLLAKANKWESLAVGAGSPIEKRTLPEPMLPME